MVGYGNIMRTPAVYTSSPRKRKSEITNILLGESYPKVSTSTSAILAKGERKDHKPYTTIATPILKLPKTLDGWKRVSTIESYVLTRI